MAYSRTIPRARVGTTGVSVGTDIAKGEGTWLNPPDRVSAITVAVHIPDGETAEYNIQCSCSPVEDIGQDGEGGYWDNIQNGITTYNDTQIFMLTNCVTGIRVNCINASRNIHVDFVG